MPPPKNLHSEVVGTTYFQFAWDPVPDAAYFRLYLYRASDSKLVLEKLVLALPENNFAVLDGLEPGVNYNIAIRSICANGQESVMPAQ